MAFTFLQLSLKTKPKVGVKFYVTRIKGKFCATNVMYDSLVTCGMEKSDVCTLIPTSHYGL